MPIFNPYFKTVDQIKIETYKTLISAIMQAKTDTRVFSVASLRAELPEDKRADFTRKIAISTCLELGYICDFEGE